MALEAQRASAVHATGPARSALVARARCWRSQPTSPDAALEAEVHTWSLAHLAPDHRR